MAEQIKIEVSQQTRTVVSGKWIFLTASSVQRGDRAEKEPNSHGKRSQQEVPNGRRDR